MRTTADLLREDPALRGLAPAHRETIAGCARNCVIRAGDEIMREGDPGDAFYIVREGAVAIVTQLPGRGEVGGRWTRATLLGW